MLKRSLLIILLLILCAAVSAITSYFIVNRQGYVRFVSEPRKDNPDYGYLEVAGNKFYQLHTTTEIKNEKIPSDSHIHAIDIRKKE